MDLKTFVLNRNKTLDLDYGVTRATLGSKTRSTRLLNRPARANLEDVTRLAVRLKVHPLYLIERLGMGRLMITDADKQDLRQHWSVEPIQSQPQLIT